METLVTADVCPVSSQADAVVGRCRILSATAIEPGGAVPAAEDSLAGLHPSRGSLFGEIVALDLVAARAHPYRPSRRMLATNAM